MRRARYASATIEFSLLGPLDVRSGGSPLGIGGARERALLVALLTWPGEVVHTDRLIDAVWGDHPPRTSGKALQNLVLRLRKSLGPAAIETCHDGYSIRVACDCLDVRRFERLVADGRDQRTRGDWEASLATLAEAVGLWRGAPLSDLRDWAPARHETVRLEEVRRAAIEELAEVALACRRHREWIADLEVMVAEEPLRERRWALLMLALHRSGRQAEALRAFQRARAALAEIGIEPGSDLVELERAITLQVPPSIDAVERADRARTAAPHRAVGRRRHNLPAGLTPFVGRIDELAELRGLLERGRLVTLTGVGGGGKTRLALEVADQVAERYRDGVWLVELAGTSDEGLIVSPLATSLGITVSVDDGPADVERLVRSHLATRRVLLLVDNCEHLVGAVARIIHALLASCPDVSVMATSRELLGLPEELPFVVPPLSLPPAEVDHAPGGSDAVAFFCERAACVHPPFRLIRANAEAVAAICRRLDGIPLALELAAARLRVLSIEQLSARLDESFRLLRVSGRTTVPRHQTLRAALDWSYELLSHDEQAALRRLAVFRGSFDLEAAEAVVGGHAAGGADDSAEPDGFELIAQLVNKSLLQVDRGGDDARFRLLEPIRQYALELLREAGEEHEARECHRDVFLLRALGRRSEFAVLADVRDALSLSNYRAALEWSWAEGDVEEALSLLVVQFPFWFWSGYPDAIVWLERVLAASEPADGRARACALARLALVLHDSGRSDPREEEQLLRDASAMARRLGHPEVIANVDWFHGELHAALGRTATARSALERAARIFERCEMPSAVGWCHYSLGWVAIADREFERARRHFEEALRAAARCDPFAWLSAHALASLAPLEAWSGDRATALRSADEAVERARRCGFPSVLVMALTASAETAVLAGSIDRANEVLEELLDVLADQTSLRWVADALEIAAVALDAQMRPAESAEALASASALRAGSGGTGESTRVIADDVERTRGRGLAALGPEAFALHRARGAVRSRDSAIATALANLEDGRLRAPRVTPWPTGSSAGGAI